MDAHDRAQRESQPVPYWPGQRNPLMDAIEQGIVRPSVDFDECGVLAVKHKPKVMVEDQEGPPPQQLKPLPFQQQTLVLRAPLARLDKACSTASVPKLVPPPQPPPQPLQPPQPPPQPPQPPHPSNADLEREVAELKREVEALTREKEFLDEHVARQGRVIEAMCKVYTQLFD